jgi:hypothetical protein
MSDSEAASASEDRSQSESDESQQESDRESQQESDREDDDLILMKSRAQKQLQNLPPAKQETTSCMGYPQRMELTGARQRRGNVGE